MNEVHAHEILHMMEGNNYTKASFKDAIIEKFGADQRFYTCSADNMTVDQIIDFLAAKGKFTSSDEGFTVDLDRVCSDY